MTTTNHTAAANTNTNANANATKVELPYGKGFLATMFQHLESLQGRVRDLEAMLSMMRAENNPHIPKFEANLEQARENVRRWEGRIDEVLLESAMALRDAA